MHVLERAVSFNTFIISHQSSSSSSMACDDGVGEVPRRFHDHGTWCVICTLITRCQKIEKNDT